MPTPKSTKPEKPTQTARKPAPPPKRWVVWLLMVPTVLYFFFLVTLAYAGASSPEQWWWSSLNLYLPQWLWAIPGAGLILLFLALRWKWAWMPGLLTFWVLFVQMGFVFHLRSPSPNLQRGTKLRLMTYNIKAGRVDNMVPILEDIRENKPDVLLFQESHRGNAELIRQTLYDWHVVTSDQYLIASQLPLSGAELKTLTLGDTHLHALRCVLTVHNKPVTLYTVHLHSPRSGLNTALHALRHSRDAITDNTDLRLNQARLLADFLRHEASPLILTGDLNAPVRSQVCREFEDIGLRDAFSESGRGYGYTYGQAVKWIRSPYLRIDHILLSAEWTPIRSFAGNREGSEHRPVFADVYLPN